jgi:periplasmic copper chaperone A
MAAVLRKLHKNYAVMLCALMCLLMGLSFSNAQQPEPSVPAKHGNLKFESPWIRAPLGGSTTAAGYVSIDNRGVEDRLLRLSTVKSQRSEIHEMSIVDAIMRMRELPQGLIIPKNARTELKSGSNHLMLIQITAPFKIGDKVPITLYFEKAGAIDLTFDVRQGQESVQESMQENAHGNVKENMHKH